MKRTIPILVPIAVVLLASFTLLHFLHTELPQRGAAVRDLAQDTIASYAEWHAEQRRCMKNGSCSPPLLVWQCPQHKVQLCAGLGDRMRGVQFALLFAILTRRVLLLDWPADPFEVQTVLQPAAIDWTVPSKRMSADLMLDWYTCNDGNVCENGTDNRFPSVEHLPMTTLARGYRRKERLRDMNLLEDNAQDRLQWFERVSIIQRFRWDTTRLMLQAYNSKHEVTFFADVSDLQLQRALTNALFQPSAAVRDRMNKFDVMGRRFGAVHIRTGEDFKERDNRFKKVRGNESKVAQHVMRTVKAVLQKYDNVSSKAIYVASDSQHLKQQLRKVGRTEGLVVHSVEHQALHIAKIGLEHEKVALRRQLRDMFVDVFVDLFMLSSGCVLFSSGSGFSNAAWQLGRGEEYVRVVL